MPRNRGRVVEYAPQDRDERDIQLFAADLRRGLSDSPTRVHLARLTGAAMGDETPEAAVVSGRQPSRA
jgi:hypothetical protein